jgi:hypothetical protein
MLPIDSLYAFPSSFEPSFVPTFLREQCSSVYDSRPTGSSGKGAHWEKVLSFRLILANNASSSHFIAFFSTELSNLAPDIDGIGVNTIINRRLLLLATCLTKPTRLIPATKVGVLKRKAFLWDMFSKEHVELDQYRKGLFFWKITLNDGEIKEQVQNHKRLRLVEDADHSEGEHNKSSDIHCHDAPKWIAWAADPKNVAQVEETRSFLESKVTNTDQYNIEIGLRKKVRV